MLTIRTRLALWYTLAFLIAIAILVTAFLITFRQQVNAELRRSLQTEERWLQALYELQFSELPTATGEERLDHIESLNEELEERYGYKRQFGMISVESGREPLVFVAGVRDIELFLPKDLLARAAGSYDLTVGRYPYRVTISQKPWGKIVVGQESAAYSKVLARSERLLIWILPLGLLLVSVGGWLLAKLALRPVVAAAARAESISMHNLDERLPAYRGGDEFGTLVSTLNTMIARLETEIRRLRQFTQDAAHELRTPLTVVRGELELAYQNSSPASEDSERLQKLLDRVIHLSEVVENLLLLASADRGAKAARSESFPVDALLRDAVEDFRILSEDRDIDVRMSHCDPIEFVGDRHLIRQLVYNLCDNALKFTKRGHIDLQLHRNGEALRLNVADTGEGIHSEHLPHIFDRFYRVDEARTWSGRGSGLGLSICKWIVEAHDGSIAVSSEPGKGTSVEITLPLQSSQAVTG